MSSDKSDELRAHSKGERTRAKLLAVAAAEFAQRGYHNTKVGDIVKSAGLSQPSFYLYFESKEAAYEELVAEFRLRLQTLTRSLLIEKDVDNAELEDHMGLSFLKFLDFLADDRDLTEIGFFQPPGCTDTKKGLASWIGSNIAKEQKNGLFYTDVPAAQIGKVFVGMIDQMARDPGSRAKRIASAKRCALILCRGMSIRQPGESSGPERPRA